MAAGDGAPVSDPAGVDRWVRRFVSARGDGLSASHLLMTLTYAIKEGSLERREAAGVRTPIRTLEQTPRLLPRLAVLIVEAARALVAARFVTGYVYCPRTTTARSPRRWSDACLV